MRTVIPCGEETEEMDRLGWANSHRRSRPASGPTASWLTQRAVRSIPRRRQPFRIDQTLVAVERGDAAHLQIDQGAIDMIGAQSGQPVRQAGNELVRGEVFNPDLGRQEQVFPGRATVGDGLPDLGLIAADLRGVDVPLAQLKGLGHRIDRDLALEPKGADPEGGNAGVGASINAGVLSHGEFSYGLG